MSFDLEKLFIDVFAPQVGDVVTVMYDLPHGRIADSKEWQARRQMAETWQRRIAGFAENYAVQVQPVVTFAATGAHNADLPALGTRDGQQVELAEALQESTIVLAMTQFSASAPLVTFTRKYEHLRIASMPLVSPAMEQTSLAADYAEIARRCEQLAPLFEQANAIEVTFSTGHHCTFDISNAQQALKDDGRLHPGVTSNALRLRNLPSGEVAVTPNENEASATNGEIPVHVNGSTLVFVVEHNRIVDVRSDDPETEMDDVQALRRAFHEEPAQANIAEVAIGCNDKAVVTGNVLEDEKAGFHWAYGRSEHLGGTVGPDAFSSPDKVIHQDIVYATGNPIVCSRLDFVFPGDKRRTVIVDGQLQL
jgi:leucyl aminopeptidase (aminopeptidase T)